MNTGRNLFEVVCGHVVSVLLLKKKTIENDWREWLINALYWTEQLVS